MKKSKWLILGGLFLVLSSLIISTAGSLRNFLPSREIKLSHTAAYVPLLNNHLFIQEITLTRRYLNRIDILLGNVPNTAPTTIVFLLADENHRILWSKRFSSAEIDGPVYYPFEFDTSPDIGKGGKVYACIYSPDSDPQNFVMMLRNPEATLGTLTDLTILNNDISFTIQQQSTPLILEGSMGVKIYETNSLSFSWLQVFLYIICFSVSLLIVFHKKIRLLVLRININPEQVFLGISVIFGLAFAFITPPFQVADEPSHLFRTWQVSEFNLFKSADRAPESLIHLAKMADRMQFMAHEKTSIAELRTLSETITDYSELIPVETPDYLIPYIPQAAGMSVGHWLGTSFLGQMYLARILNLLVSIFILFLAIRTTPIIKWLFFLLSVLPMVLYQVASLSYDAMTISLSFLLISVIFKLAFGLAEKAGRRDLVMLFVVAGLLALCKPPYYIIALAFLIIPVSKFGSRKRYLLTFLAFAATIVVFSQLWSISGEVFRSKEIVSGFNAPKSMFASPEYSGSQGDLLPSREVFRPSEQVSGFRFQVQGSTFNVPGSTFQVQGSAFDPVNCKLQTAYSLQPTAYNPNEQQRFILESPLRYLGVLGQTLKDYGHLYLISFIGLFGWVDTPLPRGVVVLYYIMLLFISLTMATPGVRVTWWQKTTLFSIFLLGFILVETAMYLCCNLVGSTAVLAVQGRYFVAFGPLIFTLFYNNRLLQLAGGASSQAEEKARKRKRNKRKDLFVQGEENRLVYMSYIPWLVTISGTGGLLYSLYVILTRFYIVTL